jgi:membrane protein required for colicin V production
MDLAVIDYIFIVLTAVLMIRCYLRGFIKEIMSMTAVVLGLLASLYFYKNGADFIRSNFMPETKIIPEILAFIALFFIVFLSMKLLEKILKDIVDGVKLGGVDRFLGLIFGLTEGIVLTSLILFLIHIQPLFDPNPVLTDSIFANVFLPLITGTRS